MIGLPVLCCVHLKLLQTQECKGEIVSDQSYIVQLYFPYTITNAHRINHMGEKEGNVLARE